MEDARDLDPEVRKERVKLLVGVLTAIGVTAFIGSTAAPLFDAARKYSLVRSLVGTAFGMACIVGGLPLLRYIKRKE
jgi:hypothetical protein